MRSREILLKISEGRVQTKNLKPNNTLICQIVTNKIFWQSKEVISCLNPVWNDSKNFPISVNTLTLHLIQQDPKSNETLLGSINITMPELLNNRKNWWDLKSANTSIALILLEVYLYTSPPTSPIRYPKESPSFQISPSTPQHHLIDSEKLIQESYLNDFLEKIKLEYSKLGNEKMVLNKIQKGLKNKETFLAQERMVVECLKKENGMGLIRVEEERKRLSREYTELKREKYVHRTQKVLINRKIEKAVESERVNEVQREMIFNLGLDMSKCSLVQYYLMENPEAAKQ